MLSVLTYAPSLYKYVEKDIPYLIEKYSVSYGIDNRYIYALAKIESDTRHTMKGKLLTSKKGAVGIMQITPRFAPENYQVELLEHNIAGACRLMYGLFKYYGKGDLRAFEAYNCGISGRKGKYKKAALRFRSKISNEYHRLTNN